VHRYSLDYPAFKDRDLTPKYSLVENLENPVSPERRADHEHADKKPDDVKRGGKKGDRR